jgi:predicted Fe-Mo cluster-binding NifX family protein
MKRRRSDDLGEKAAGDGAMVSVAVVSSRTEAQLIVGMLRNNNVTAALSGDDAGGLYPALQTHGIRVLVAHYDEATAHRLLAAADERRHPGSGGHVPP